MIKCNIILGVRKLFKRLLVLFCLLLLVFPAYATVYLLEPVDQTLSAGEAVSFGKIARGETLKVVVKKKSDLASEWTSLSVDEQLLPDGWSVESVETDKTLIVHVSVPKNAPISTQRIRFTVSSAAAEMFDGAFYATVSVQENLLSASIENLAKAAVFDTETKFSLVLSNDSVADHSVRIESSLPGYWFSSKTVELKPHETKVVELPVFPKSYGEKNFSFIVSSLKNSKRFSFPAKLNVKPTLAGMYQTSIGGFSFFSPGMLPSYLINGLLSLIS